MKLKTAFVKHTLRFKFEAGTSRGSFTQKDVWFVKLWEESRPETYGLGEAAPLPKLSIDDRPDFEEKLRHYCRLTEGISLLEELYALPDINLFPSILFALETAFLDLNKGGRRLLFDNGFAQGKAKIPINGLIWMGDKDFMLRQIKKKLEEGYTCIKMKIGAIDFDREMELLAYIRKSFSPSEITLRVDANGAFSPEEALPKLQHLSRFGIHSIEQPIKAGQWEEMAALCRQTPVPIALDEELIGIHRKEDKERLLRAIQPQYIILKPSLIGGLQASREWINTTESQAVGWWITSALESNVGLNAIAQFCGEYPNLPPQGLGTGQLFHNNIEAALQLEKGLMGLNTQKVWGTRLFS